MTAEIRRLWWALVLLVVLVYGRALGHALLWWDDRKHICTNLDIRDIWTESFFGMYIPVSYSVWKWLGEISAVFFGPECLSWSPLLHAFNLVIHIANGYLVYRLLSRFTYKESQMVAIIGAAVFLLHPLQVEAVAWVSAGRDLLATLFGLLALVMYLDSKPIWSVPLFAISMLAKPLGVIFPLLALLMSRRRWKYLVPSLAVAGALSIVTKKLQGDSLLQFQAALWERPLIALQAYGFYIMKLIIPWPLVPDYRRSVMAIQENPNLYWVAAWCVLPFLLVAIFRRQWFKPVLWIVIAVLPVSGLVNFGFQEISTVADRFFYVAMVGVCWGISESLLNLPAVTRRLAIAVLLVLAGLSFWQTGYWENDEILFHHNIDVNDSIVSHGNYANSLFHEKNYLQAEPEYRFVIANNPRLRDAWLGLARTMENTGRPNEAEKIYREAIEKKVALPAVYNNLANLIYAKGTSECEGLWKEAARLDPGYMEPRYNLGQLYLRLGKYEEAFFFFLEARRLAPRDPRIQERIDAVQKLRSGGA
jgi:protein O-mannosyl-transferase